MKSFQAFLSALLVVASTSVGALGYDAAKFSGKGSRAQYEQSVAPANRGIDLLGEGKFEEAIKQFDKSMSIYPLDAAVHSHKGVALANLSRHPEALAEFRKSIQLEPAWAGGYNNLAFELLNVRDFKGAEINSKTAIKLAPKNPVYVLTLAEIYIDAKRTAEAKALIDKASSMTPMQGDEASVKESIKNDLAKLKRAK